MAPTFSFLPLTTVPSSSLSSSSQRGSHPRARHRAGTQAVHCIVNIQNDIQMHVSILGSGSTMQLYVQFNVHCMVNHTSLLILGTRSRHPSGSRSRSPRSCSLHIIAYKCVDLYTIICKEHDFDRNAISEPTHVPYLGTRSSDGLRRLTADATPISTSL